MRKQLSTLLRETVNDILDSKEVNSCTISLLLYSFMEPSFKLEVFDVQSLKIEQDFLNSYTDVITTTFSVTAKEYLDLIDNYRDLKCSLIIESYTDRKEDFDHQDPIVRDYKIIFSNKDDLFKTLSKEEILSNEDESHSESQLSKRIHVSAQLLDDKIFEIRKQQYNLVVQDATMEKILHFIVANLVRVDKKCIIEPDNTIEYENVVIRGLIPFDKVFSYLNNKYGIYDTGIGYYYTEETMFIYPLYNNNPSMSPYIVNVYFVGSNNVVGAENYCIFKNDCYHILSNTEPASTQLMEQGTENFGNGFIFFKDSMAFNEWRTETQDDFIITAEGLLQMQVDNDNTVSEFSHNLRYVYGEESISQRMAGMSAINGNMISLGWMHARPFIIKPGWKIIYHYDGEEDYRAKNGSCLGATYTFSPTHRTPQGVIFQCNATLLLFTE